MTDIGDHPLAALLRLAPDATPLELAELLWLGAHLPAPAPRPPPEEIAETPPSPQPILAPSQEPSGDEAAAAEALIDATAGAAADDAVAPQGQRRQGRIVRQAGSIPRLLWHRCLHQLAPQRATGRPTVDVFATVQFLVRTGELVLQTRRELEPQAALFLLDDRAASSAPWLEEIDTLTALAAASGRWTRVERHALRSSERIPLGADPTAPHRPAVQAAEGLAAHLRAQPRSTEDVTVVLSDGVAAGWRDGTVARVLYAAPGRRVWAHLWAEERVRQPGLARWYRTTPNEGVVLVPFTPAGVMSTRGWLHGRGGDLDAVRLPAPGKKNALGPAPAPSWSELARRVEVGVPIEVRQILALAAGVPGDFNLDLLGALGDRIATRRILPVHLSQALTSGLVERVNDAPGLVVRFRGDDTGDAGARAIALRWLDQPRAEALLQTLTDHLDDGAADALGIPYALLLSLRGAEVIDGVAPRAAPGAATALRGLVRLTRRRAERVERWLERVAATKEKELQSSAAQPAGPVEVPPPNEREARAAEREPDLPHTDDAESSVGSGVSDQSNPPAQHGESATSEDLEVVPAQADPSWTESSGSLHTINESADHIESDRGGTQSEIRVLISYASEDAPIARELSRLLKAWSIQVFLDTECIPPGAVWANVLDDEVAACGIFVALVSREWNVRPWCQKEYHQVAERYAKTKAPVLVPVLIGEGITTEISPIFNHQSPTRDGPLPRRLPVEQLRHRLKPVVDAICAIAGAIATPTHPLPIPAIDPPLPRRARDWRPRNLPTTTFTARLTDDDLRWEVHEDGRKIGEWPAPVGKLRALVDAVGNALRTPDQVGDLIGELMLEEAPVAWRIGLRSGPFAPRRCQIRLDDAALLRVPWPWARLDGRWLAELWMFELAPTASPIHIGHLHRHAPVVVIAARNTNPHCKAMVEDIRTNVASAGWSPDHVFHRAPHPGLLANLRPSVIVLVASAFHGRPEVDEGHGTRVMSAAEYDALSVLDGLEAVVLLGINRPLIPTAHQLRNSPALIWSPHAFRPAEAARTAPALVRALLSPANDPSTAADFVAHHEQGVATSALIGHRRWATWTTPPPPLNDRRAGRALLEIGRDVQRLATRYAVQRHAKFGTNSRVLALVGLAEPDEKLRADALNDQLLSDLERHHPEIRVDSQQIEAHLAEPYRDASALDDYFASAVGDPRSAQFRNVAKRFDSDRWVVWINAGTVSLEHVAGRLVEWLVTLARVIKPSLPTDLSVVLLIVGTHGKPDQIAREIKLQAKRAGPLDVEIRTLPPLTHLTLDDIYEFLIHPNLSACPPEHAEAVAEAIFENTRGLFGDTVSYIERHQQDRFRTIIREISG